MTVADALIPERPAGRNVADAFGHPRGLAYLVFAEAWERFSYYGMQALLVLYLGEQLLLPGHVEHVAGFAVFRETIFRFTGPLTAPALASVIFGLYAGLVYVTPLIGGFVADRWLGRTWTVAAGAMLMAIGHFLMAFEASFVVAILCLIVGVGGFKGNLSTQVGELYAPGDHRRGHAFQIFFLGINLGALFSPIVCGTLGERIGWHWGFGAAGVGMLIGLGVYLSGRRWLPSERPRKAHRSTPAAQKLTRAEWLRVALLIGLVPVLAAAQIGNSQGFNAYLVWSKASYDLNLFGHAMPVTWLLTFGSLVGMTLITASLLFWRWWARRRPEPDDIGKIALGGVGMTAATLILAYAAHLTQGGHRISLGWGVAFELVNAVGYANFVPITYSLFAAAAPPQLRGVMVAICLLQFFVGNMLAGALGTQLGPLGGVNFWLIHSAVAAIASVVLMVVWLALGRFLASPHTPP